jgi:hypothetical protein
MKKLLILFSICTFAVSFAFSQDDQYYTGDEATVTVKANIAPPAIPDYVQPPCPGDGYLWNPGYWAWGTGGYYWVPGVWVMPPAVGLLWTPGYWGFYGGYYGWHHGYWGNTIGYYGGINYGFGYFGTGFYGGRWEGGHFRYNSAVWRVGGGIHNTYVEEHHVNGGVRASFNGPSGVHYRPQAHEVEAMHAAHTERTQEQVTHHTAAGNDSRQFHSATPNHAPAYHSMSTPGGQRYNAGGHAVSAPRGGGGGGHSSGGGHGGGRR